MVSPLDPAVGFRPQPKPPPLPLPKLLTPPNHSAGEHALVAFLQVKWSNEQGGNPPTEASLPAGLFYVDFSSLKYDSTPSLMFYRRSSNHYQGTKILVGGGGLLLKVQDADTHGVWHNAPNAVSNNLTLQGVSYPWMHETFDMGVLLSAWIFSDGLLLLMQWDDIGGVDPPTGPDYDYDDNQSYFWLPVSAGTHFNAIHDPRYLTVRLVKVMH
jgi:hypothetical protein